MRKGLKIIFVSILILFLFRGTVFRFAVKYEAIGTRPEIKITSSELIDRVERESHNQKKDLRGILEIADRVVVDELSFTMDKVSDNPNTLIYTKRANCVGYSSMYHSIVNYLIRKNNLQSKIGAKHKIGALELFGISLHQFFENPFFKSHDFNEVKNKITGEKIFIDPTVSDYFWIKRVAGKK